MHKGSRSRQTNTISQSVKFFLSIYAPLFPMPVNRTMMNMIKNKNTEIVAPIPQSCVTRKCCSMAVPSVMTRFPAINLVNMNSDNDGMNTTWHPVLTPSSVSGKMTRLNVMNFDAPKSLAASMSAGLMLLSALKIGKIINGMKMYTETNTKLKSVNSICFAPMPMNSKKLFAAPYVPKIPMNA